MPLDSIVVKGGLLLCDKIPLPSYSPLFYHNLINVAVSG